MSAALWVASGGALGALARWAASGWIQNFTGGFFPWGTVAVNVTGSFLLGFAVVWLQASAASPELRQAATIGVLGSFTTFSTYSYETVEMLRDGVWLRAGGYALGSLAVGLVAVALGAVLATVLLRTGG